MRNVDINIEWAKSLTKDEFVAHFSQNNAVYGWSELDAEAFWNGLHPMPVGTTEKKKVVKPDVTEETK